MRCHLQVRRSYPYLTTERFPHNWAIADMVKGYIAGTRKEHLRQAREEEGERKGKTAPGWLKKAAKESDTDDNDAVEDDVPAPSSSTKGGKSTKSAKSFREEDEMDRSGSNSKSRKSTGTDDSNDNEAVEDEVPPPSSSTKARKLKKSTKSISIPENVEILRTSSSSKSGKSTKRSAASLAIHPTKQLPRHFPVGNRGNALDILWPRMGLTLKRRQLKNKRRTSRGGENTRKDQGDLEVTCTVYAD